MGGTRRVSRIIISETTLRGNRHAVRRRYTSLSPCLTQSVSAANVTPEQLDQIFAAYNKVGSPGCALGVIRNSRFVYRKAYRLGSLELRVPLTSESDFYMASVSKQFIAAAVVLAANRPFVPIDDDVRNIFPSFPTTVSR